MSLQKFIVMISVVLLSAVACSKKDKHSAPAAPPQETTNFYINNNTCYDANTHTPTNMSHCQTPTTGGGNSQYQWVNQVCVDTQTGWVTNIQNCTTGTASTACYGTYIYVDADGFSYTVYCNGSNCSGQGLYESLSGYYVMCQ